MNNLWNYPLSGQKTRHNWQPTPHRKAARSGTRSTQEKLNLMSKRIRAEQEQKEN
ncbi:MAG: hypothetical protein WBB73_06680 [Candidatus Aminicenantaceae bacterium]